MWTLAASVPRLPVVETLGSISAICSDRTGTLTRNEMTVRRIVTADATFTVSVVGYDPIGEFQKDGVAIQPPDISEVYRRLKRREIAGRAVIAPAA